MCFVDDLTIVEALKLLLSNLDIFVITHSWFAFNKLIYMVTDCHILPVSYNFRPNFGFENAINLLNNLIHTPYFFNISQKVTLIILFKHINIR